MTHELTITSAYARSHSGKDYTGRCDCGWTTTRGGSHQNYQRIIAEAHSRHLAAL